MNFSDTRKATETSNLENQGISILHQQLNAMNLPAHPSTIYIFKRFCTNYLSKFDFINDIILRIYANAIICKLFQKGKREFYKKVKELEQFNKAIKEINDFLKIEENEEEININRNVCNLYSMF